MKFIQRKNQSKVIAAIKIKSWRKSQYSTKRITQIFNNLDSWFVGFVNMNKINEKSNEYILNCKIQHNNELDSETNPKLKKYMAKYKFYFKEMPKYCMAFNYNESDWCKMHEIAYRKSHTSYKQIADKYKVCQYQRYALELVARLKHTKQFFLSADGGHRRYEMNLQEKLRNRYKLVIIENSTRRNFVHSAQAFRDADNIFIVPVPREEQHFYDDEIHDTHEDFEILNEQEQEIHDHFLNENSVLNDAKDEYLMYLRMSRLGIFEEPKPKKKKQRLILTKILIQI